jgi:phospholipid/cholesterol/gamma-HCH transport system substrate-binding protein
MPGRTRWSAGLAGAVAGALLLSGCDFDGAYDLPLPGSPVDADEAFEVTAEFDDVLNVVPRSPVMVDDVVVGEVTEVERVGWHAKVTLRVREDVDLPDNTSADIRQVSLLGEKYVALEAPAEGSGDGRLGQGDAIPLSATGRNPEVEEVLGALSFLLSGGGVAQLGKITEELNLAMNGREDELKSLIGSLEGIVATVDSQKVDIINAMESLNGLAETLNEEKDVIGDALDAVGPAVEVLSAQHDEMIQMLGALDRLGKVGTRVITASKDDVLAMLEDLGPVLNKLTQAGDKLAPGLNLLLSFPFPKEAGNIVHGDYANTTARINIDLNRVLRHYGLEIPPLELPDLGETINHVGRCLGSGSLTSTACAQVVNDIDLLGKMKRQCKKPRFDGNHICAIIEAVPDLGDLLGQLGIGNAVNGLTESMTTGPRGVSAPSSVEGLLGGGALT